MSPFMMNNLSVLIIDDMQAQQATLRSQLSMLHIQRVDVTSTAEDALRLMKSRQYSAVMCDYNLDQKTDGQQLLEHARETGLLPPQTLFFMVTAENSYAAVASVSEHKPDAYLLKPVAASDIEERLRTQLDRRQELLPAHTAMQNGDLMGALAACDAMLEVRSRWTMAAMQLKGQLLMKLGRHEEAAGLYGRALHIRPGIMWATLGLAKAQRAIGNLEEAKGLAYDMIRSKEGEKSVEAYDLVADCLEREGDADGAMWVLRSAVSVLPSARRKRVLGETAYRNGDLETAKDCFTQVTRQTKGSVTARNSDILMLAQVKVDSDEAAEAMLILDGAAQQVRHDAEFASVSMAIKAQMHFKAGDTASAEAALARARQGMRRPKADLATLALAKAQLAGGHEDEALKLLGVAVSADHENQRARQMIGKVLRDTGREHLRAKVIDDAVQSLNDRVARATAMFRDNRIDEALTAIETALREYPENTSVLLQAAQLNCMALRLKKHINIVISERVRSYLVRLDALLPGNDRVAQMHRYFRETLATLKSSPTAQVA